MTLSSRVLPRDEWGKLDSCALMAPVWRGLVGTASDVVVVETETGEIVGLISVMRALHADGLWIDERYREEKSGAFRRLFAELSRYVRDLGFHHVLAGSDTDRTRSQLLRLGATPVPYESYLLPVWKE